MTKAETEAIKARWRRFAHKHEVVRVQHAWNDISTLLNALETAFEEQIESKNSYNDLSITYDLLKQHTEELVADLERETAAHTLKNALIADLEAERDRYKTLFDELEKANDCSISQLSALAYEDTGLTPGQVNTLLKIAKAIICDSEPWEGDKQFCHVGHLRRLFSVIEHNSRKPISPN